MMNVTRLKDIREDNDINQVKISKILNVNRSTYSLWELGINIIPLKYLYVFEYGSGSILEIVLDYNDEREIEDILEANDLKESMCSTMVSTTMLRIEQVNKD